jgi:hypothetical protein
MMETESIPETSDLNHPKHLSATHKILLNPVAVTALKERERENLKHAATCG